MRFAAGQHSIDLLMLRCTLFCRSSFTFCCGLLPVLAMAVLGMLPVTGLAQNEYWSVDAGFDPVVEGDPGVAGIVLREAYPGGKLLVGTSYSFINGVRPSSWVVRLNADGSLDESFHAPGTAGAVLAVYSDGRILCGIVPEGLPGSRLVVRLLPDGALDPTFSAVAMGYDYMKVRILPDQRILLQGSFTTIAGEPCRYLARLLANGTRDPTFTSPYAESAGDPGINALELAPDGEHIVIAGGALGLGAGLNYVARLNADGSVDSAFNTGSLDFPWHLLKAYPQADGSVVLSDTRGNLMKLTTSGAVDPTFSPSWVGTPDAFGRKGPDGTVFYTTMSAGGSTVQLRRLTATFQDDPSFAAIGTPYASAYQIGLPAVMDDGTLILGALTAERYEARLMLTRVLADGTIDAAYNPRFSRPANLVAQALQPDGRLLVAGAIDHVNGVPLSAAFSVVRLLPDGSQDPEFSASLPAGTDVTHLSVRPDGRILVLGYIPIEGGPTARALYLTNGGSIDAVLAQIPELAVPQAVDAQGRILTWQSDVSPSLRRWLADGTPDGSFTAPAALVFTALAPLSDGRLVLVEAGSGGSGTLRVLTDGGAPDPTFVTMPVSSYDLVGLIPLANGELVVCNREAIGQGNYALRLRRLGPDGVVMASYTSRSYPGSSIASAESQLAAMGAFSDWYVASGAGAVTPLAVDVARPHFRAFYLIAPSGPAYRFGESGGFGSAIQTYSRIATCGPSFDPGPFEVDYWPVRTDLVPVNARFEPNAKAGGLEPFTYAWFKDGQPIPNATGQQLVLTPVQAADGGTYAVQVSNAYGTATGGDLNLTIDTDNVAARVSLSPVSQTAMAGTVVTLSAAVVGSPAPTFQWYFNGNAITGAEGSTLIIPVVSTSTAGSYYLRARNTIANAGGTQTYTAYSAAATLTVTYPFDTWREERFTSLELADANVSGPAADPDGDGYVNLVEYALGLAPKTAETSGLPTVTVDATDWIYTYTRPADRTDVTYTVEVSTDLTTWVAPAVPAALIATDAGIETWQAKQPLTSEQTFFRLKLDLL